MRLALPLLLLLLILLCLMSLPRLELVDLGLTKLACRVLFFSVLKGLPLHDSMHFSESSMNGLPLPVHG